MNELRGSLPWIRPLDDCDQGRVDEALGPPDPATSRRDLVSLAAQLYYDIAHGRPCPDGNKRIAFTLTLMFVRANGWDLASNLHGAVEIADRAAEPSGDPTDVMADVQEWIRLHLRWPGLAE